MNNPVLVGWIEGRLQHMCVCTLVGWKWSSWGCSGRPGEGRWSPSWTRYHSDVMGGTAAVRPGGPLRLGEEVKMSQVADSWAGERKEICSRHVLSALLVDSFTQHSIIQIMTPYFHLCVLPILFHSLRMSWKSCMQMMSPHELHHIRADIVYVPSDKYGLKYNNEWLYAIQPCFNDQEAPRGVTGTGNPLSSQLLWWLLLLSVQ